MNSSNNELPVLPNYIIEKIDFATFTDSDWDKFLAYDELIESEIDPGRPYSSILTKTRLLTKPPNMYIEYYLVRSSTNLQIVGQAMYNVLTPEASDFTENGHTVRTWITVHPDHRRNKIGTTLLKILSQRGLEGYKTEISFSAPGKAGMKFMEHFGGISALDSAENRLNIEEVNWKNIEDWHTSSKQKSPDAVIETYETIPEDTIEQYAKVQTALLNDVPFGDLGLRFTITPEQIRKWEAYNKKLNYKMVVKILREKDGTISGMSDVKINLFNKTVVEQNLTGVIREFRGRNIGMLLKTDMLLTIKEQFPEAKMIVTGNADKNAPMLKINYEIGFKRANSWHAYKFVLVDLINKIN